MWDDIEKIYYETGLETCLEIPENLNKPESIEASVEEFFTNANQRENKLKIQKEIQSTQNDIERLSRRISSCVNPKKRKKFISKKNKLLQKLRELQSQLV